MTGPDQDEVGAEFGRLFGRDPDGVWAAPGRINLIGEHTDYNDGFVLPFAIRQRAVVAAAPAEGRTTVRSLRVGETVRFTAGAVAPGDVPGWAAYVAGVFWALRTSGNDVPELEMVLGGDVPLGSGLSSSAAVECATACAVADLAQLNLDRRSLALEARRAENEFVGAPTGVMDQMASMFGRAGHAIFIDARSLAVDPVPFDLAAHDLALIVIDTRTRHALVDGGYAARRASCEAAASALAVRALRDVTAPTLDAALARLGDEESRKRVRHVVTENERVLAVVAALHAGADPRTIGKHLTASHESLRDDFEVSTPALDLAVSSALAAGAYGARMTGGGFGGCAIALVDARAIPEVGRAVQQAFADQGMRRVSIFQAVPSTGAQRLDTGEAGVRS